MTNSDSSLPTTSPTSTAVSASIVGRSATISKTRKVEPPSPVNLQMDAPRPTYGTLQEWIRMHPDDARRLGFLPKE